jgi:hypothetical protein
MIWIRRQRRHPLVHVETIAVQEMAGDYVGWRLGGNG